MSKQCAYNFKGERAQNQQNQADVQHKLSLASSSGYGESGALIPTRLRKDLRELLDVENVGVENYKMLADRLGYPLQFIRWLESKHISSPTDILLTEWENKQKNRTPKDALRHLQEILSAMKRADAVEKVQEYFNEFLIGKETTV